MGRGVGAMRDAVALSADGEDVRAAAGFLGLGAQRDRWRRVVRRQAARGERQLRQ
jgi:hypothetical protein